MSPSIRFAVLQSLVISTLILLTCQRLDAGEEIDELRVSIPHVEVHGDGPIPMILIPDNGYDWQVFQPFMDEHADDYTMYAVTLPGMAGTEAPEEVEGSDIVDRHTLRNAIAAIREVIHERELQSPVLVGHGMGGHLATWLAIEHPEDTRAAISLDGLPHLPMGDAGNPLEGDERRLRVESRIISAHRQMTQAQWEEAYRNQHYFWVSDANRAIELADNFLQTDQEVVIQYLSELLFSDLREDFARNERPILFVAPVHPEDNGGIINFQWTTALGDNPRNCTLMFVAECSHFVWEDDPWIVDESLETFLSNGNIENSRVGPGEARVINPELDEVSED